jgi:hypothetical protein
VATNNEATSVLWVDSHPWISLDDTNQKIDRHLLRVELLECIHCYAVDGTFFTANEFTEQEMMQLTRYAGNYSDEKEGDRAYAINYFLMDYVKKDKFSVASCMATSNRKTHSDYINLFLNFQHSMNPCTMSFDYKDNESTIGIYSVAIWINYFRYWL